MRRIIFGLFLLTALFIFGVSCDSKNKYNVTFRSEFHNEFTKTVKEGEKVSKPDDLIFDGHNFLGWYVDDELYDFDSKVTEDIIINAKWELIEVKYKVLFQTIDEEKLYEDEVVEDNKINKPVDPEKEGYVFEGWFTDGDFTTLYNFDNLVNNDIVLYAKFSEITYNISYDLDGGICDSLVTVFKYNEEITLLIPEKEGYKFLGWFEGEDRVEAIENKNYELTAKWEEIKKYNVNYDLNGGKFSDEVMNGFDKELISLGSFNISQMNFYFWDIYATNIFIYSLDNNPNPIYALRLGIKEIDNGYLVVCKYTSGSTDSDYSNCDFVIVVSEHNGNGYSLLNSLVNVDSIVILSGFDKYNLVEGEISVKADVVEEGEITTSGSFYEGSELLIPSRSGYEFLGWYDDADQIVSNVLNKDVNVKAKWERKMGPIEDELDLLAEDLSKLFSGVVSEDLELITSYDEVNATVTWTSSNEGVISNDGKVNRVLGKEVDVKLTAIIYLQGSTREVTFNLKVSKLYKDLSKGGIIAGYNYTGNIPDDTTLKSVDILYCAFGEVAANGKISNYSSIKSNLKNYIDKAHAYGDYVIISISTSNLATVASSDSLINVFADDLVKLINECDLDGIDMDWETPTASTKTNYTRLMKVVREKVKANNSSHLVTSALGAGPWQYVKFDLENSHKYLDYINLMSYDMQTNAKSSYHNALYKSSKGYTLTQCSIDQTLPLYNALGVPNEKIIIGVPFYARVFKNTDGLGKASEAAGSATQEFLYTNFLSKTVAGVTVGWDDECKVPYIYDANNRKFYSYENEKSIGIKCQYIHDKGLAGMMYWQRTQDYQHKLLNAIYQNKTVMENK